MQLKENNIIWIYSRVSTTFYLLLALDKKINFNSLREWIINYIFVGSRHSDAAKAKIREARLTYLEKNPAVLANSHVGYEVAEVVKYI
jgi:hypothetical protein